MLARPSVAFAVGHTGASKVVIGKLDDVVIDNEGKVVNGKLDDQPGPGSVSGYAGSVSGYASMEQESREEEMWRKPSTGKQFRSAFAQELEMEEGLAMATRGSEVLRGQNSVTISKAALVECVHGMVDCAVCAITDEQVEAVRRENLRLKAQIERIERVQGDEERHAKLQAEVEQLTWKLRKMEESRRVYEDATSQLGSFLELVSSQLTVSGRFQRGSMSLPPAEEEQDSISPRVDRLSVDRRQRRARSLVGGERRRRSALVRDNASDLGVRESSSDLGVVGRAPDSVSESTDSDLGPRLITRGGEARSTLSRVRNFLRREKKEKQREEERAAKARGEHRGEPGEVGASIMGFHGIWSLRNY